MDIPSLGETNQLVQPHPGQLQPYYSRFFSRVDNQKLDTRFQTVNTNVNANMQLKNLWFVGMFVGYVPSGNDFYEPRVRVFFSNAHPVPVQSLVRDKRAKIQRQFQLFRGSPAMEFVLQPQPEFELGHRYRFSDHLSVAHSISYNPVRNDAGFYSTYYENGPGGTPELRDIIFRVATGPPSRIFFPSNTVSATVQGHHPASALLEPGGSETTLRSAGIGRTYVHLTNMAQVAISNKNFNILMSMLSTPPVCTRQFF